MAGTIAGKPPYFFDFFDVRDRAAFLMWKKKTLCFGISFENRNLRRRCPADAARNLRPCEGGGWREGGAVLRGVERRNPRGCSRGGVVIDAVPAVRPSRARRKLVALGGGQPAALLLHVLLGPREVPGAPRVAPTSDAVFQPSVL